MNGINSSMNSYDNNYKLHWNLILFDFRRLLLPSLRRSSANNLFSFFCQDEDKDKEKGKGTPLSTYSLPSIRKFQGQQHFLLRDAEETIELHVHHQVIVIGIRNASNDDLPLECRQCGATGRYYSPDVAPCTYLYEARTKYIVRCTRELFQVGFWLNDNISHWRGCVPPSQG